MEALYAQGKAGGPEDWQGSQSLAGGPKELVGGQAGT